MFSVGPKTLLRKYFSRRKTKIRLHQYGWFGRRLHDPDLWHFGRRSVAGGVGLGLFLAFIPIPIQMLLAVPCAIIMRVNLPVTFTAIWATNPITFAPMFIFAFKVGSWITGYESGTGGIPFEATFDGLAATLHDIWYPLVVGCFVCGLSAGAVGSLLVRWLWRLHLINMRRKRRQRALR
ncbi:MAG: DUF2062 domain-containing protein [Gammaproteobacteria bacterium]|jgi:hypothetical protein|nr:DUF2062 domain-containing protein [Gammaproteobacteria bacterium]HJP37227.1 DUF2062 domain-containing protein [Gammaproteobacteria bacterium]